MNAEDPSRGQTRETARGYDAADPDDLERAFDEAERLRSGGNPAGALEAFLTLLTARLAVAGDVNARVAWPKSIDLVILERLAGLAILFGHLERADELLAQMVRICEQSGNAYAADFTRLKRIHLALGGGQLRKTHCLLKSLEPRLGNIEAMDLTPDGLKRWEAGRLWPDVDARGRELLLSLAELEMGQLLVSYGQYREALAVLAAGLSHVKPGAPDLVNRLGRFFRLNQAAAELERGELKTARAALDGLDGELDFVAEPSLAINAWQLRGKLALVEGRYGEALEVFRQIAVACDRGGLDRASVGAVLNLSEVLVTLNQTRTARDLLMLAREHASQLGDAAAADRAARWLRVARARGYSLADGVSIGPTVFQRWTGRLPFPPTSPDDPSDDARPIDTETSPNMLTLLEDRALRFHWEIAHERVVPAARELSQVEEVFSDVDSPLIQARIHVMRGMLAYQRCETKAAANHFDEALEVFRAIGALPELWQVRRLRGWCGVKLGWKREVRAVWSRDTAVVLEEMAATLPAEERAVFLLNKWTEDEEYIAGRIDALIEAKEALLRAPWHRRPRLYFALARQLDELVRTVEAQKDLILRRDVQGDNPDGKRRPRPVETPRPLWLRILSHSPRRVTLKFLSLPDVVLVIRSGWMMFDFGVSPLSRLQLRGLVTAWHESVRGEIMDDTGRPTSRPAVEPRPKLLARADQLSDALARGLQIPEALAGLPPWTTALTVVPDDALHHFPFSALKVGGYDLRLLPSVARESDLPAKGKNLVVVSVIDGTLHFRIFDQDGILVVNTSERTLAGQTPQIVELKERMASLCSVRWPGATDRDRLITAVRSIVGHDPVGGRYLIERYALSIGFHSGETDAVPHAQPAQRVDCEGALVMGVTRGITGLTVAPGHVENLPPLRGVAREVEAVASDLARQHVPAVDRLLDDRATREAVLSRLPHVALWHASCHGVFVPERPDASGLVLVPERGRGEVVTLRDILALDLSVLKHVSLSSCWLADTLVLPGRWVIGLPETLHRAGVGSCLACLWPVDTSVGVAVSESFYLLATRRHRDSALRAIQLACLNRRLPTAENYNIRDPLYWACFVLHGDHRRLQLPRHRIGVRLFRRAADGARTTRPRANPGV